MSNQRTANPRVAFFDIETAPALAYTWAGAMHEQDLIEIKRPWYILCFAVKWMGEKKVHTYSLPDYKEFKRDIHDDSALVKELHRVFSEASVLIAHNGIRFDERKARARFLYHGLKPPPPAKSIDTLRIARSQFGMSSNRLSDVGQFLGLGGKLPTTGKHLWLGCSETGDRKSFKTMARYCARDVELLAQTYERLAPYSKNHPDLNAFASHSCPVCRSSNVQHRGVAVAVKRKYERLQCQGCGHWFKGELVKT